MKLLKSGQNLRQSAIPLELSELIFMQFFNIFVWY